MQQSLGISRAVIGGCEAGSQREEDPDACSVIARGRCCLTDNSRSFRDNRWCELTMTVSCQRKSLLSAFATLTPARELSSWPVTPSSLPQPSALVLTTTGGRISLQTAGTQNDAPSVSPSASAPSPG